MGFLNPVEVRLVRGINTEEEVVECTGVRRRGFCWGGAWSRVSLEVEARSGEMALEEAHFGSLSSPRIGGSWLPGSENMFDEIG